MLVSVGNCEVTYINYYAKRRTTQETLKLKHCFVCKQSAFSFIKLMSRSFNNQEQLAANSYDVLQRTGESLQRSNQIAYESEQIGTEVLSELSEQRESLLRSSHRLGNADNDLSQSRSIIRKLQREVLYNKLILILIIIFELAILVGLIMIKFIKF